MADEKLCGATYFLGDRDVKCERLADHVGPHMFCLTWGQADAEKRGSTP